MVKDKKSEQSEPVIRVGIMAATEIQFVLKGRFFCGDKIVEQGAYSAQINNGSIKCSGCSEGEVLIFSPQSPGSTFVLKKVTIGIGFHWEQMEDQEFEGGLTLQVEDGSIRAINVVLLESYLKSVISSEMSAMNDPNLLNAHAIVSRSWLLAQIRKKLSLSGCHPDGGGDRIPSHEAPKEKKIANNNVSDQKELIRWYDREDHATFDVCADDHCQRYQGVTKVISDNAGKAIEATRGLVLTCNGEVCDARYSKCCGGISENFENVWQPIKVPYLIAVRDIDKKIFSKVLNLRKVDKIIDFIATTPEAFCNTTDPEVLSQVLIDFDRATTHFYRWKVEYGQQQLSELIAKKSGIDFGHIFDLVPLERGQSGRIIRLKIVGEKETVIVGKELEIRKCLSETHLYSSAFVVEKEFDEEKSFPSKFILNGAGWGHGVGMCQIGAAVMSRKGYTCEQILEHYFTGAKVERIYI